MGELVRLRGNEYVYRISDFSHGLNYVSSCYNQPGFGDRKIPDSATKMQNFASYSGRLEPVQSDATWGSAAAELPAVTASIDYIFPYMKSDGDAPILLTIRNGKLYEWPESGSPSTVTAIIDPGSAGTKRYGAQALGYNWIGGLSLSLLRYNYSNPGSLTNGKLSLAGTAAPSNSPTLLLMGAGNLTSGTGYTYRYAWEYGVGRELGMGWRGTPNLVTCTGVSTSISITMDANPPTSFSHAVSRALFRTTTAYQSSFFLVTRTNYTGSSLPTSYLDTIPDAEIELGEETDPVGPQDTTDPPFSELLPPRMTYVAVHEGRLWGLDIWKDGVRYPNRVVYSRIAGIAPHFDQFETGANIQAIDASAGLPTGLVAWMGNLYAFFERGISVLSSDPAPGKLASFAQVVYGRGCIRPQSIAVCPEGIVFLSSDGLYMFSGSPNLTPMGNKVGGLFRAINVLSSGSTQLKVGGYDPLYREYHLYGFTSIPVEETIDWGILSYSFQNDHWYESSNNSANQNEWSYTCQVGPWMVYGLASITSSSSNQLWKKHGSTLFGMDNVSTVTAAVRAWSSHPLDFGMENQVKTLRYVTVVFEDRVTPSTASSFTVHLWREGRLSNWLSSDYSTSVSITRAFTGLPGSRHRFNFQAEQFIRLQPYLYMASSCTTTVRTAIRSIEYGFTAEQQRTGEVVSL